MAVGSGIAVAVGGTGVEVGSCEAQPIANITANAAPAINRLGRNFISLLSSGTLGSLCLALDARYLVRLLIWETKNGLRVGQARHLRLPARHSFEAVG